MDKDLAIRLLAVKNVLSVKEAAMLMGRSERTIRNKMDEIPHYDGPMGIVFRRDELEAYMCQEKFTPVKNNHSR